MDSNIRALCGWFTKSQWPVLRCPTCGTGSLLLAEGEPLANKVSTDIANWQEWGDPTDIGGVFTARLECNRSACREIVAVIGSFRTDWVYEPGDVESGLAEVYRVRSIYPAVSLFVPPEGTPESVRDDLRRAAATIWLDPPSATTSLRRSLESLLTEQGVPTHSTGTTPKRLTLHDRLVKFRNQRLDVADLLEATKWVGNDATHEGGEITSEETLVVAEFVELALEMVYVKDNSAVLSHAKAIVQAKKMVPKPK